MGRPMNQEHEFAANVDTIVHLGAGNCSDLATWQAANPRRIVLVEPNPDAAKRLTALARDEGQIHVVQQAVGDPHGSPRLRRFNIPALSSLREPTGLLELFPGLRTERELDVDVIEPVAFIQGLELEQERKHWLIIDTPGEEAAIVNALQAGGQLEQFDRIILHCTVEPLYRESGPATAALDELKDAGYDINQRDDSDPDRPAWTLDRNPLRLENQALRRKVAELEQQAKKLERSRDEKEEKIANLKQQSKEYREQAERAAALTAQLDEVSAREQALREQIMRSEGQIELVKDLLLDGSTL